MTQPPPMFREPRERTPNLVLRASTDAAAPGEREPVARAEAAHDRDDQEQHAGQDRTGPHRDQPDGGRGRTGEREPAGT